MMQTSDGPSKKAKSSKGGHGFYSRTCAQGHGHRLSMNPPRCWWLSLYVMEPRRARFQCLMQRIHFCRFPELIKSSGFSTSRRLVVTGAWCSLPSPSGHAEEHTEELLSKAISGVRVSGVRE